MSKEELVHSATFSTSHKMGRCINRKFRASNKTSSKFHHHHHHSSNNNISNSYHKLLYLTNFWIRILNFSVTFSVVNVFNFGSTVSYKLHPLNQDIISKVLLKLPYFCKYMVILVCSLLFHGILRLTILLLSAGRMLMQQKLVGDIEMGLDAILPIPEGQAEERATDEGQEGKVECLKQEDNGLVPRFQELQHFGDWKWINFPSNVCFTAIVSYEYFKRVMAYFSKENDAAAAVVAELTKDWKVTSYRMVPLRAISRIWGWLNNIYLPVWMRKFVFSWYAYIFDCNVMEIDADDLREYNSLGEFFRRGLKPGVRPICPVSPVVSPVDGTILNCGKIENGCVEQVKGVTYSLPAFLGPQTWDDNNNTQVRGVVIDKTVYCQGLLQNPENELHHCIIYLAPGDYHRFHSPTKWNALFRRHFAGDLFSVNPRVAKWIAELFSLNERAVYVGEWEHGFFSYTAVGATNVGSIKVYKDEELVTNCYGTPRGTFSDKKFDTPITMDKADDFGEFNLGSTVVLVFEAPRNYEFVAEPGQKIHLGESLCRPIPYSY